MLRCLGVWHSQLQNPCKKFNAVELREPFNKIVWKLLINYYRICVSSEDLSIKHEIWCATSICIWAHHFSGIHKWYAFIMGQIHSLRFQSSHYDPATLKMVANQLGLPILTNIKSFIQFFFFFWLHIFSHEKRKI